MRYYLPDRFREAESLRFISPTLKHIVFPVLSHSGYFRHSIAAGPAVVTYHGVFPPGYEVRSPALDGNLVSAASFKRQLQLLKKRYYVISPDDFLGWVEGGHQLPPRSVLLTCDDALQNTLTGMLPILQELGLPCLFFATGASVESERSMLWYEELYLMLLDGTEPVFLSFPQEQIVMNISVDNEKRSCWWNLVERLSRFDRQARRELLDQIRSQLKLPEDWKERVVSDARLAARFQVLNLAGLQQLVAAGMTFGAHSLSHPVLARAPEEVAWREISESRAALENALGRTVWAFGYPFGNAATVSAREIRLAEQAGFRCAFLNSGGGFGVKFDRFSVPRVHVTADMGLAEFEAHIAGFYRSLREKFLGASEEAISA